MEIIYPIFYGVITLVVVGVFLVGINILVSKIFNVTVVNRRGTVLSTPEDAGQIADSIKELAQKTKGKIKNIKEVKNIFVVNNAESKLEKLEKLKTFAKKQSSAFSSPVMRLFQIEEKLYKHNNSLKKEV